MHLHGGEDFSSRVTQLSYQFNAYYFVDLLANVSWKTHNPHGLPEKDKFIAKYCDVTAKSIVTVDSSEMEKCGST